MIPNRLSIEDQPAIVDEPKRICDWETDTVIGKNHKQTIVSIVKRKTEFTLTNKIENKTAKAVRKATVALQKLHQNRVRTITSDNGQEFTGHEEVAE